MKLIYAVLAVGVLMQTSYVAYSAEKSPAKSADIPRKVLQQADLGNGEELRMMLVELPPEFSAIEHTHPVVGVCYVIEGTAESQYEGEEVKTFTTGQSFQDSATKQHVLFRNPSKTDTLRFTCTAKIKKGQAYLQLL